MNPANFHKYNWYTGNGRSIYLLIRYIIPDTFDLTKCDEVLKICGKLMHTSRKIHNCDKDMMIYKTLSDIHNFSIIVQLEWEQDLPLWEEFMIPVTFSNC